MSGNTFLVDYLNSAVGAIKELDTSTLTDNMKDFVGKEKVVKIEEIIAKVISAIQDTQRALHQNLGVEKLRNYFDEAWVHVQRLREEIEKVYDNSPGSQKLLQQLTLCQLSLQQFQTKLADKLNVEVALEALTELQDQLRTAAANSKERAEGLKDTVKDTLVEKRDSIIESTNKAIEQVRQLRDDIRETGIDKLKSRFESAYASVNELKERLIAAAENEGILSSDIRQTLLEKTELAQTFLSGFQERIAKLTTLELAMLALKDLEESVQGLVVDGKEKLIQSQEKFSELIVFSREQISKYQTVFLDANANTLSYVKETYESTKEAVANMEKTQLVLEVAEEKKKMLVEKIAFVKSCIDDTIQSSRGTLRSHISMLNLSAALTTLNQMKYQITDVNNLQEQFHKVQENLQQLIHFEKIKSLSTDKVKELYGSAFESFSKLRSDLQQITHERKVYFLEQFNSAYTNLTVACTQQKTLSTCMNVTLDAAVVLDTRFNLLEMASSLLQKAKEIDDKRLSGRFQNQVIPFTLETAVNLDQKYADGKVQLLLQTTKDEFVQKKETILGVEEIPVVDESVFAEE